MKMLLFFFMMWANPLSAVDGTMTMDLSPRIESRYIFQDKVWKKSSLNIFFLDGTEEQQTHVKKFANEWLEHCGLTFNWGGEQVLSDIRITFKEVGFWSLIGTDACKKFPEQPTMNLSCNKEIDSIEFKRCVLHEFGHALGLEHEHFHPDANLQLDKEKAYDFFLLNDEWTREQTDEEVFQSRFKMKLRFPYDPLSIMHYQFDKSIRKYKKDHPINKVLSAGDKLKIGVMYPKK